jgi:tetratricopeptide (TPR) repeat protein
VRLAAVPERLLASLGGVGSPWRFGADITPADEEYIAAMHQLVRHIVSLDVAYGGETTSMLATQSLSEIRRRLRSGRYLVEYEKDLQAIAGEMAELAGWLLCDANRQSRAHRANEEALTWTRLSGDRAMELFVIHNMSLQATYLRQPERSLELVRPVLDRADATSLTPRLRAIFELRLARAYAQMGLRHDALKVLQRARSLLHDGTSERDPDWTWWISERGFDHATGALLGGLGDWKAAIDPICQALDITPANARRDRFLYLCILLHAQVESGAWKDAESTAGELIPMIGVVRSQRPLARLAATIQGNRANRMPRQIQDIFEQIQLPRQMPERSC